MFQRDMVKVGKCVLFPRANPSLGPMNVCAWLVTSQRLRSEASMNHTTKEATSLGGPAFYSHTNNNAIQLLLFSECCFLIIQNFVTVFTVNNIKESRIIINSLTSMFISNDD